MRSTVNETSGNVNARETHSPLRHNHSRLGEQPIGVHGVVARILKNAGPGFDNTGVLKFI
jgi:hypothetical protein